MRGVILTDDRSAGQAGGWGGRVQSLFVPGVAGLRADAVVHGTRDGGLGVTRQGLFNHDVLIVTGRANRAECKRTGSRRDRVKREVGNGLGRGGAAVAAREADQCMPGTANDTGKGDVVIRLGISAMRDGVGGHYVYIRSIVADVEVNGIAGVGRDGGDRGISAGLAIDPVSYTHLRAHETGRNLVCRLLL